MSIKLFKVINAKGVQMTHMDLYSEDYLDDKGRPLVPTLINPLHITSMVQRWQRMFRVNGIDIPYDEMPQEYPYVKIDMSDYSVYFFGDLEQLQISMANPNNYVVFGIP